MANATGQTTQIKTSPRVKRAWCWQYFNEHGDDVICTLCEIRIKYFNSTSSMIYHLAAKHQLFNLNSKKRKLEIGSDCESDSSIECSTNESESTIPKEESKKVNKINEKVVRFIVGTNQPLSMTQNPLFVDMVCELRAHYKLPGQKKMETRLFPQMVNN